MTNPSSLLQQISVDDAIRLGANSVPTFGKIWFPRVLRQDSPQFHYDMSQVVEAPGNRLVGFKVFRGGAKTTIARIYTMKRIAYCISRTIQLVNINAPKAEFTLRWIKRQVEFNKPFAAAFKLRKGEKWTDNWATIYNAQDEPVNIVAGGITGSLRGLNIDDYRPDFVFCDDISDRENTATDDQRLKQDEAFFAQLVRSLTPDTENPMAQLVLAQTPINTFDLISRAERDPQFHVFKYSCFGPDGLSAWPTRFTTEALLAEKQGYINRNQLAMWLAEMECELVSAEAQAFRREWLKYFSVYPEEGQTVIILDPASSEEQTADFFAIAVLHFFMGKVYLLEYSLQRGMMPDAAWAKVLEFADRYGVRELVIETVAYQKILAWYFEQQMLQARRWFNIHKWDDKRQKDDRMVQAITLVAPWGRLLIREGMQEFEEVFQLYGPGYKGKVDLLDAVSIGISWKMSRGFGVSESLEGEFKRLREAEEDLEDINEDFRGCP